MFGDIDKSLKTFSEKIELVLCKSNKEEEIAFLNEAYGVKLTKKYRETDELEFYIPHYMQFQYKQIKNSNWDLINGWYTIKLNNEQYFVIDKVKLVGEDKETMYVHCYSEEYVLSKVNIEIDVATTWQLRSDDTETGEGIFTEILPQYVKNWTLGTVEHKAEYADEELGQFHKKYRIFDGMKKSWLDFLLNDVQKSYECVLEFDTLNNKINIYNDKDSEEDKQRKNKGLYISNENYLKNIVRIEKSDEIVTRLYVYGKDNLNIASYNPTGQLYIEDYSYFKNKKYMSQDLIEALDKYEEKLTENTSVFYNLLEELNELVVESVELENKKDELESEKDLLELERDVLIKQLERLYGIGENEISNLLNIKAETDEEREEIAKFQNNILNLTLKISAKDQEIENQKVLIENKENQIKSKNNDINQVRVSLSKKNNFTEEQLKKLEKLTFQQTWANTNYFNVKELYFAGKHALSKISSPPIEFETDVVDFLDVVECQHDWNKLVKGDYINIFHSKLDIDIVVKLVKIEYDRDGKKINLTFSNKDDHDDAEKFISNMLNKFNNSNTTIDIFKGNWDKGSYGYDLVTQMRESALDAAKNKILSQNPHQKISIDGHGIWCKDGDNEDRQLRIVADLLVMTTDGFKTVDLAISPQGIVGQKIVGKIVASNQLIITNRDSNGDHTFMVNDSHMEAYNMDLSLLSKNKMNRIYLNPEEGIKIQRKDSSSWKDTMWLDMDGKVHAESFVVMNTNSVLDDNGLRIDNGCIWINNKSGDDIFKVNTDGEVDANGRFRVFRYDISDNKICLADLYKDTAKGGKLLVNDWNGNINAFLGSAPDYTYTGGFFKLYNGDKAKERIEIGIHSLNDMGVMKIKNNQSKKIVEITGNDSGGTIKLNNKEEKTKLFISSQDESLNQGIIKLYGEDDKEKIIIKAKSSIDNVSSMLSGDRKTGGFIQFRSYDNSQEFFITANNENNFGMYDKFGSAFEINHSSGATIMSNQRKTSISLADDGMSLNTTNLNGLRIAYFSGGEIKGTPTHTYMLPVLFRASSNFSGTGGTTISHNFGDTNYSVAITPTGGTPEGNIGEIRVVKSATSVTVYNSGSARSGFDCIVLK